MKIISGDEPTNDETIKIRPRRVYECKNCVRIAERKDVNKRMGDYFCRVCGGRVTDITSTTTGHDFMEIVCI